MVYEFTSKEALGEPEALKNVIFHMKIILAFEKRAFYWISQVKKEKSKKNIYIYKETSNFPNTFTNTKLQ